MTAEAVTAEPDDARQSHLDVVNPATFGPERAEAIYQAIHDRMARDFTESGDPVARQYQQWERLNRFPYASAGHGRVYVNNYANPSAAPFFGRREATGAYPEGSIVVKDAFVLTEDGDILTGDLGIIEKRGDAADPGGWRFIQIRPDGSVIGARAGDRRTEFCAACHVGHNGPAAPFFFVPPNKAAEGP